MGIELDMIVAGLSVIVIAACLVYDMIIEQRKRNK